MPSMPSMHPPLTFSVFNAHDHRFGLPCRSLHEDLHALYDMLQEPHYLLVADRADGSRAIPIQTGVWSFSSRGSSCGLPCHSRGRNAGSRSTDQDISYCYYFSYGIQVTSVTIRRRASSYLSIDTNSTFPHFPCPPLDPPPSN
jgi:hypothetical protein